MRLHRLLRIIYTLLSHESVTAKKLSVQFNVSVRTIYRDIQFIERAGIPLYTGAHGGFNITPKCNYCKIMLSEDEIRILISEVIGIKSKSITEKMQIFMTILTPNHSYRMTNFYIQKRLNDDHMLSRKSDVV